MRKRILFVDDEPNVLAALRCLLHREAGRWDMVFAAGPQAALAELQHSTFDIVVSDLRMPGLDGEALLAHIQAASPQTIRLVLSGSSFDDRAVPTRELVDEVLQKACRAPSLRATIERWLAAAR